MTNQARQVIELAAKLTHDEQIEVVEALLKALGHEVEFSSDDIAEWERRAAEAKADPTMLEDADEVMAQLRADLRADRL